MSDRLEDLTVPFAPSLTRAGWHVLDLIVEATDGREGALIDKSVITVRCRERGVGPQPIAKLARDGLIEVMRVDRPVRWPSGADRGATAVAGHVVALTRLGRIEHFDHEQMYRPAHQALADRVIRALPEVFRNAAQGRRHARRVLAESEAAA